jgi:Uma2 family endonuclease
MTIIDNDIAAIRQAIRRLSRIEREELAEWILNLPELGVAETAPAYRNERRLSVEEYLDLEEGSTVRHEFVAGRVFAMASPLLGHEIIVSNLLFQFQTQLRGGPCMAFGSSTKVRMQVGNDEIFYIPDVTITCGAVTDEVLKQKWITDPRVVVEVLSPSTQAVDLQEKALNYRHIPSLEEYLVVASQAREVTLYRREDKWDPVVLTGPDDVYESRAVEVNIPLSAMYERMTALGDA